MIQESPVMLKNQPCAPIVCFSKMFWLNVFICTYYLAIKVPCESFSGIIGKIMCTGT